MITEKMLAETTNLYGKPFRHNAKGHLTFFNEQFFAELFFRRYSPVYITTKKQFFMYNSQNGLWEKQSPGIVLNKLGLFLHECSKALQTTAIETKRKCTILRDIKTFLEAIAEQNDFFGISNKNFIHCANGFLEFDLVSNGWKLEPFSPDYCSLSRCELSYAPQAKCPQFDAFLQSLLENDDIELIEQYMGQCLLGRNITQTILLVTGLGGCGKSTLSTIIELLMGSNGYTQIRPEHIGSRFETNFFMGKTLLSGKESKTSFFTAKGMSIIKSLVGNDDLRAEGKCSNQHEMIKGIFNVIIVGNSMPKLEFESKDDQSAYRRRFRWIRCKNFKPEKVIPNLAEKIFSEEGSGILNRAINGAKKILESDSMPCSNLQNARLDYLFGSAEPLDLFLASCIERNDKTTITSEELFTAFSEFCISMEWIPWKQRDFQKQIPNAMLNHFQQPLRRDVPRRRASDGKMTNRAGFFHVRFKN